MGRVLNWYHYLLPLVGVIIILPIIAVSEEKVVWTQQGDDTVRQAYVDKLNKPCKITRIPLGPDGRPKVGNNSNISTTTESPSNSSTTDSIVTTVSYSTTTVNTTSREREGREHVPIEHLYKPIADFMVIDPCHDEENRSFMECVLTYKPNISESDPVYNTGICMCYRDWSNISSRSPAYNHDLNFSRESQNWFTFSPKHGECVIKVRKRCAPGGTLIVPYRCEDYVDQKTNKKSEARCVDSGVDPHFMICVAGGGSSFKMSLWLIFLLLLPIY